MRTCNARRVTIRGRREHERLNLLPRDLVERRPEATLHEGQELAHQAEQPILALLRQTTRVTKGRDDRRDRRFKGGAETSRIAASSAIDVHVDARRPAER